MKSLLILLIFILSSNVIGQKQLGGTNFWNCIQWGEGQNCENYLVINLEDSTLANGYYTNKLEAWQFEEGFNIPSGPIPFGGRFRIPKELILDAQFIVVKCYFQDGQLNGLFQVSYENVFELFECEFTNNKIDGFLILYNQLQDKIAHVNFKNGILNGNCSINDINNPKTLLFQGNFQNGYSSKVNPYQLREDGMPYPYHIDIKGVRFFPLYEKNEEINGFDWVELLDP